MSEESTTPGETAETNAPATEAVVPVKRKPLSHAQWQEIRTKAELGVSRVSELGREYGITSQAVSQHLKLNGVVIGSKASLTQAAITAQAAAEVAAKIATFAEKRAERLEQTREFYYKAHASLDGMILKKIGDAVSSGSPISSVAADLKALNFAKRALLVGRSERFHVLDAETHVDPETLPDLIIEDLSSEQIRQIQAGDQAIDDIEDVVIGEFGSE